MSNRKYTTQFSPEELENEEWKDVVGFEGVYSVSNLGRIRRDRGGSGIVTGRIFRNVYDTNGYPIVSLQYIPNNKPRKTYTIHRLVAAAFFGPVPKGLQCNHKDGNKANNRVSNLEYITPRENTLHAIKNGLRNRVYKRIKTTHCRRGHKRTPENTYIDRKGFEVCKECRRIHKIRCFTDKFLLNLFIE